MAENWSIFFEIMWQHMRECSRSLYNLRLALVFRPPSDWHWLFRYLALVPPQTKTSQTTRLLQCRSTRTSGLGERLCGRKCLQRARSVDDDASFYLGYTNARWMIYDYLHVFRQRKILCVVCRRRPVVGQWNREKKCVFKKIIIFSKEKQSKPETYCIFGSQNTCR